MINDTHCFWVISVYSQEIKPTSLVLQAPWSVVVLQEHRSDSLLFTFFWKI